MVGLGIGTGFGFATWAKRNDQNAVGCATTGCPGSKNDQASTDHSAAVTYGLVSDIAFGVGAAGVIGAIALWATAPHPAAGAPVKTGVARLSPVVDGSSLRVELAGAFE